MIRTVKAELLKNFKNSFFTKYMLFFNLVLPFGLGLTYYFIYLPFPHDTLNVQGFKMPLLSFTLTGQIVYLLFVNMLLMSAEFTEERLQGTLETIFLTPCSRFALLIGGSLAGLTNYMWFLLGMLSVVFFLPINPQVRSFPAVGISVILAILSTIIVGMLLQASFVASRRGSMWATVLQEPVIFVSGIVFPLQYAPRFVQLVALVVPLSYSVFALRVSLFAGATVLELSRIFLLLTATSALYALITMYCIRLIDLRLRKEGTLQLF